MYTIYLVTSTEELGQYYIIKYIIIFAVKYRNRVKICCQINYEKKSLKFLNYKLMRYPIL